MTKKFKVPSSEIEDRITKIQKRLQKQEIDGLFVIQRADLFYLSGTAQNGFLYIPAQGDPLLLIRKYIPRARQESSIGVPCQRPGDLCGLSCGRGEQKTRP